MYYPLSPRGKRPSISSMNRMEGLCSRARAKTCTSLSAVGTYLRTLCLRLQPAVLTRAALTIMGDNGIPRVTPPLQAIGEPSHTSVVSRCWEDMVLPKRDRGAFQGDQAARYLHDPRLHQSHGSRGAGWPDHPNANSAWPSPEPTGRSYLPGSRLRRRSPVCCRSP